MNDNDKFEKNASNARTFGAAVYIGADITTVSKMAGHG